MDAIYYSVSFEKANEHLISVTLTINNPNLNGQILKLPTWIAGSYMIREFAKDIVTIKAFSQNQPISINKIDKNTFFIEPNNAPITVVYDIYCFDTSVRMAYVDTYRAFFNGTSVFFEVITDKEIPYIIDIQKPKQAFANQWRVATALTELKAKRYEFGTYIAQNYDELVDSPVEIGDLILEQFESHGCTHTIAINGTIPQLNIKQLTTDFKKITDTEIELFDPKTKTPPVHRYVFLISTAPNDFGGLEHRASCVLLCPRTCFPTFQQNNTDYVKLLKLTAHEYFHTWWVKRIKPAPFHPYDLSKEIDTSLLWVFEGFTTYYESLVLLHAQLITKEDFLKTIERFMNMVLQNTAHKKQSLLQAGMDAWIKYYRPNANTPNANVNYYIHGALIALYIDCIIRNTSNHNYSLDNVLQELWTQFGREFYHGKPYGIDENILKALFQKFSHFNWDDFFARYIYNANWPDLASALAPFGIETKAIEETKIDLRIKTKQENNQTVVTQVLDLGCAQKAGLCPNDIIVAIDNLRVMTDGSSSLNALLSHYNIGDKITMHVFRNGVLLALSIDLASNPLPNYQLNFVKTTNQTIQNAQSSWLENRKNDTCN